MVITQAYNMNNQLSKLSYLLICRIVFFHSQKKKIVEYFLLIINSNWSNLYSFWSLEYILYNGISSTQFFFKDSLTYKCLSEPSIHWNSLKKFEGQLWSMEVQTKLDQITVHTNLFSPTHWQVKWNFPTYYNVIIFFFFWTIVLFLSLSFMMGP